MPTITELCRELRQHETPAEKTLWQYLRNRHLVDHKFLRQYPICISTYEKRNVCFIADFYCDKAKLVIEADGPVHLLKKDYDMNRDEVLKELGLTTLRFTNDQILNDVKGVLCEIKEYIAK